MLLESRNSRNVCAVVRQHRELRRSWWSGRRGCTRRETAPTRPAAAPGTAAWRPCVRMPARAMTSHACAAWRRCRRRSADSPDRESAWATRSPTALREHVFERRHARPQVAQLQALARRQGEQTSRARGPSGTNTRITSSSVSWHSKPAARQRGDEPIVAVLGAHFEDAAPRALQFVDRARGGDAALVHDDDVVAAVLDVGQQVRAENQVHALVVPEVANQRQHLVAALRDPCRWSARRGTAGRDRAPAPGPA